VIRERRQGSIANARRAQAQSLAFCVRIHPCAPLTRNAEIVDVG